MDDLRPHQPQDYASRYDDFYLTFLPHLIAFLVTAGAPPDQALGIAQTTMIKLWRCWDDVSEPKHFARSSAFRLLKTGALDGLILEGSVLRTRASDITGAESPHMDFLSHLNELRVSERDVIAWSVEGYTPAQIASQLKINPKTVQADLASARRKLRMSMTHPEDEK